MNIYKTILILTIITNTNAFNFKPLVNRKSPIQKFPIIRYNKIHNITLLSKCNNLNNLNDFVPDAQRRNIMNIILLTSSSIPVLWMLVGFLYFFVPPNSNSNNIGILAKDANGNDINAKIWINNNPYPERKLVQGLKGDAHYLIVKDDKTLQNYAINAVCTHLGCVVPWNKAANKFMCPCHGSQYDETGKVIRGPAPQSLALAKVDIIEEKVILSEYKEIDFRTDTDPWWIK